MFERIKGAALRLLEAVQKNKERVVVVLTGLVFAPAAAAIAAWAGRHFPGVDLPTNTLVGLGISGFIGAVGLAITWLRGTQKERDNASAERVAALASPSSAHGLALAKEAAAGAVVASAPVAPSPADPPAPSPDA
jgi:hypothetical protein